ncbi:hypothetical protein ABZ897_24925 [Nonomuraea sp. NPDC046802]|uniref:hypothetical protein n=1 Tax=Nonomuraea sp. NPDC046802 TaxID=3154919 RepID=UPI0033CEFA39
MAVVTAKGAMIAAMVGMLSAAHAAHAEEAPQKPPTSLVGDVIIFNDEIIEPVSLPVSTCGGVLQVLSKNPSRCEGTSRVSDDDA